MRVTYIEDPKTWAENFNFFVEVKVRFSETDMYGHMNNTVSFTYFEYARIEFLKELGALMPSKDTETKSIPVVADLQCDYLQQVYFDETLHIYTRIAKVGNSSIELHYLAKNEKGVPCFTGRGTIVMMNPETGKSVALTNEQKLNLEGKLVK